MVEKRLTKFVVLGAIAMLATFSSMSNTQAGDPSQLELPDMQSSRVKPFEAEYKSSSGSAFDVTVR